MWLQLLQHHLQQGGRRHLLTHLLGAGRGREPAQRVLQEVLGLLAASSAPAVAPRLDLLGWGTVMASEPGTGTNLPPPPQQPSWTLLASPTTPSAWDLLASIWSGSPSPVLPGPSIGRGCSTLSVCPQPGGSILLGARARAGDATRPTFLSSSSVSAITTNAIPLASGRGTQAGPILIPEGWPNAPTPGGHSTTSPLPLPGAPRPGGMAGLRELTLDVGAAGRPKRTYHAPFGPRGTAPGSSQQQQQQTPRSPSLAPTPMGKDPVQGTTPPDSPLSWSVQVGEDAYFVRRDSMGVADGVGGWQRVEGANSAAYSRKLMHYACLELELADAGEGYTLQQYRALSPREVLIKAYANTIADMAPSGIQGSTTACILLIRDQELRICNVGDAGLLVIRDRDILFQKADHQIAFNFPYQIGSTGFNTGECQIFHLPLQEGDLIVMGTDGVFDNVWEREILALSNELAARHPTGYPQLLAEAILQLAADASQDHHLYSPFQASALRSGLQVGAGGKMDDITVLCGVVRTDEDSPDRR